MRLILKQPKTRQIVLRPGFTFPAKASCCQNATVM